MAKSNKNKKLGETFEFNSIRRGFLKPLIAYINRAVDRQQLAGLANTLHSDAPLKDALEVIFGTKYRDIVTCYTTKAFKMPGLIWGTAGRKDAVPPTTDGASVRKGAACFVRIDERTPNVIDIEVIGNYAGNDSRMFTLTNAEYKTIRYNLKELEGCPQQALDAPIYTP
mgnify:CR=1 FL=1